MVAAWQDFLMCVHYQLVSFRCRTALGVAGVDEPTVSLVELPLNELQRRDSVGDKLLPGFDNSEVAVDGCREVVGAEVEL